MSLTINLLYWFFPIFFIICYFQARGFIPPYLPGEGIYIWPLRLYVAAVGVKAFIRNRAKCPVLSIYLYYSLLSFCTFAFSDYPIKLYINDCAFFIIPILMAYIGMDDKDTSDKFYRYTFWAITVMFIIGMYLYVSRPSWYQAAWELSYNSRWYKQGINADFEYIQSKMRFGSFMMSSYATEYFGLFALPVSLCLMLKSKNKKCKLLYILTTLFIIVVVVLSMQRAAIVSSIAIILIIGLYDMRHRKNSITFFLTFFIVIFILISMFSSSDIGERVNTRFFQLTLDDAFSDARTSQNKDLLNAWRNIVIGNGLGTGGNEARKIGYPAVTDSNYVKILVEQGVVGFTIFICFLFSSCNRIYKNFKYLIPEGAMLLSIMIAMIGSNSLLFSIYIMPFWYMMGRVWNDNYINSLKINKDMI